jgi:rhodanese-related sulfurtransferase
MSTVVTHAGHPETENLRAPNIAAGTESTVNGTLMRARQDARELGLPYAGTVSPEEAWELVTAGEATLIDIRSVEERTFVGYVPGATHVAWATGTGLTKNPRFLRELEARLPKNAVGVLLCRSGKRSAAAAEAATRAGWTGVFNVDEGFEGDLDARQQRGSLGGWRYRGLPWAQD